MPDRFKELFGNKRLTASVVELEVVARYPRYRVDLISGKGMAVCDSTNSEPLYWMNNYEEARQIAKKLNREHNLPTIGVTVDITVGKDVLGGDGHTLEEALEDALLSTKKPWPGALAALDLDKALAVCLAQAG